MFEATEMVGMLATASAVPISICLELLSLLPNKKAGFPK